VFINIVLGIFNLIPIPPLDGFKVLLGIVPRAAVQPLQKLEPYGMGILMACILVGWVAPDLSPINWVFRLVADDVIDFILA
jgi:Zn-dependent protease